MNVLMIMDSSGDTRIEFDETAATADAKAKAAELFGKLTGKGARAFQVNRGDGQPDRPIKSFNEVEGEVVLVPLIVGG